MTPNFDYKKLALTLLAQIPDSERHRVTIDHSREIAALAAAISAYVFVSGPVDSADVVRVAAETLFYLGYQAGSAGKADESLWQAAVDGIGEQP